MLGISTEHINASVKTGTNPSVRKSKKPPTLEELEKLAITRGIRGFTPDSNGSEPIRDLKSRLINQDDKKGVAMMPSILKANCGNSPPTLVESPDDSGESYPVQFSPKKIVHTDPKAKSLGKLFREQSEKPKENRCVVM